MSPNGIKMSRQKKVIHFWQGVQISQMAGGRIYNTWSKFTLCGEFLGVAENHEMPTELSKITCKKCMETEEYKRMISKKMARKMKGYYVS